MRKEPKIVFENQFFFVEDLGTNYELQYKQATHVCVVGRSKDLAQIIRTAEKLSKYPQNVAKFLNC